jgi:hypothetical protein
MSIFTPNYSGSNPTAPKLPACTQSIGDYVRIFIPTLQALIVNLQIIYNRPFAHLLEPPIYVEQDVAPDHADYLPPTRLSTPPRAQCLNPEDPIFLALTDAKQKIALTLDKAAQDYNTHLRNNYTIENVAAAMLKDLFNQFLPLPTSLHLRKLIAGSNIDTYELMDIGLVHIALSNHFRTNISINAERSIILANLRTLSIKLKKPIDFATFISLFLENIQLYAALGSPLAPNDATNLFIDAIHRSPDLTSNPLLVSSLFHYEAAHNNETRSLSEVIELLNPIIPHILQSATIRKTAYATTQDSASDDEDTALLAASAPKGTKKPPTSAKPSKTKLPTAASVPTTTEISFSSADASKIQEILNLVKKQRNPTVSDKSKSSGAKPTFVKTRYCYTCGSTSGPNIHISPHCPTPNSHHQNPCTWKNREDYPGAAKADA